MQTNPKYSLLRRTLLEWYRNTPAPLPPSSACPVYLSVPLESLRLTDFPGVDEAVARALAENAGVDTAEKLLGTFLINGRNHASMVDHLVDAAEIPESTAREITDALDRKACRCLVL